MRADATFSRAAWWLGSVSVYVADDRNDTLTGVNVTVLASEVAWTEVPTFVQRKRDACGSLPELLVAAEGGERAAGLRERLHSTGAQEQPQQGSEIRVVDVRFDEHGVRFRH